MDHPSRRQFLRNASWLGASPLFAHMATEASTFRHKDGTIDWESVRADFPISNWKKIHLNSGSAGVLPKPVSDNLVELVRYITSKAPYEVWNEWQDIKQSNLTRLAHLVDCKSSELQVVRNTTEALNMIITGLDISQDAEVILTSNAYPFAVNAWKSKSKKDGFSVKQLDISLPLSDEAILEYFKKAITSNTEVIHISHITHQQGHIMPVKKLTKLAHEHGIQIVVDGAHVVGQIEFSLADVGCDYFASSLHKWLNAPLGTGLIYVSEKNIDQLAGHLSSYEESASSMDKYEQLGTRCWANEIGISAALDYHDSLGVRNKQDRLHHLKSYWMSRAKEITGVKMHTWEDHSCAVSTFSIKGVKNGQVLKFLDKEFNIHAKMAGGLWGDGIRVSPNIFTRESELDTFVQALFKISKA